MKVPAKMIRRIGPIGLIAFALPAFACAIAGEQPAKMGEPVSVAPSARELAPQYFPRVAWSAGARCWLVVWQDGAPTDDGANGQGPAQDIMAVRVGADGKVLDAKPIAVCAAKGPQQRPTVTSDGKDFFVVWHDFRNGKDWDVYAARVSGEGKALDPDSIPLSGGAHNQCFPDAVFGGGNYFVAWLDARHFPEYRIFGSRVSPAGKPLDGDGIELARAMTDKDMESWRKATWGMGTSGEGWHNFGKALGGGRMEQPGQLALASNGSRHILSFRLNLPSQKGCPNNTVAIDAATGKPIGGINEHPKGGSQAPFSGNAGSTMYPAYTRTRLAPTGDRGFLGTNFFYFWGWGNDGSGPWCATPLDPDGKFGKPLMVWYSDQEVPPHYRTAANKALTMDIAWDGKRALYVSDYHNQEPNGDIDVRAIFLNAEGKRLEDPAGETAVEPDDMGPANEKGQLTREMPTHKNKKWPACKVAPFVVASGPNFQAAPAVAAGPEGSFLVAWLEEPPGQDSRIMARVVSIR